MKKLVSLLLALCLLSMSGMSVCAEDTHKIPGELVEYKTRAGGLIIKKMDDAGSGTKEAWILGTGHPIEGDLVVPAEVDGYPVTRLYIDELDDYTRTFDDSWTQEDLGGAVFRTDGFTWEDKLTSITFPGTIKNFKKMYDGDLYAFDLRTVLKKIVIQGGTESLDGGFDGCPMEAIYLPDSVKTLGESEFSSAVPGFVIHAPEGSYAQEYALSHGFAFESVPFTDIIGHWAEQDILWAENAGLVSGTGTHMFSPNAPVTRAMFVTMLYRYANPAPARAGKNSFQDLAGPRAYYYDAVLWAADNRIISGTGSGRFQPDRPVTREEMAAVLYNYGLYWLNVAGEVNMPSGFTDTAEISRFALDGMGWAVGQGFLHGTGEGLLSPKKTATRAEAAALLSRRFAHVG